MLRIRFEALSDTRQIDHGTIESMPYVITEACIDVKDGTCVDVCPVDCIKTTPESPMYYIDPDACIDCNACRHVCPVDAIYSTYEIPPGQEHTEQLNADFFRKA